MRGFESVRLFHDSAPTIPLIAVINECLSESDTACSTTNAKRLG